VDSRAGRYRDRRPRKFYQGLIAELLEYAEREFELSTRMPDGSTRRDHAESLMRKLGPERMPAELKSVECPEGAEYLWGYFQSMNTRRSSNGYTLNAISHQELQAWAQLHGVELAPWEAAVLDQLDLIYLQTVMNLNA
jgi:hypothetical protein